MNDFIECKSDEYELHDSEFHFGRLVAFFFLFRVYTCGCCSHQSFIAGFFEL